MSSPREAGKVELISIGGRDAAGYQAIGIHETIWLP